MKRAITICIAALGIAAGWATVAAAGAVRISEVYAGGGPDSQGNSVYDTDYVELFNASGSPVDVGGWMLVSDNYITGGSTPPNPFTCAGCSGTIPSNTIINPCSYLLIKLGAPSTFGDGGPIPIPADIAIATPSLMGSRGDGALTLLSSGTPDGTCSVGLSRVDLVGWGFTRCWLGSPAPVFGPSSALVRLSGGMADTSDNAADFVVTQSFIPRNAASPANAICLQTPALPGSWGHLKALYR